MGDVSLIVIVGFWIVCGIACLLIAQSKGERNTTGAFLTGLILGPLGVLIVLIQKPQSQIEAVPWAQPAAPARCQAVDAGGFQCVLPAGHPQPHSVR